MNCKIHGFPLHAVRGRHQKQVVDLISACYSEYNEIMELDSLDADLNPIVEYYGGRTRPFFVLLDGQRVIGTVALAGKTVEAVELKRVFLSAPYRGQGIGKALSRFACAWAKDRGYRTLYIWSDTTFHTAHALYRGLGARPIGARPLGGRNNCSEYGFVLRL